LAEAAIALGESDLAARIANALEQRSGHLLVGFGIASTCYGAADRYQGLIATLCGDHDTAVDHHAAATRLHRRFRTRLWSLHSQVDTATALMARGGTEDLVQARTLFSATAKEAAGTQMTRVLQRLDDLGPRLS
jgi:hypothetical protein